MAGTLQNFKKTAVRKAVFSFYYVEKSALEFDNKRPMLYNKGSLIISFSVSLKICLGIVMIDLE